jgi:Uma2 family endonuclease
VLVEALRNHDDTPVGDHTVRLRNVTWSDYERVLEIRGERPVPRVAYLEGVLELMRPSREHELLKPLIGHLVEVWCLERDIPFSACGSWTLEKKDVERGVEPDECYVFRSATRDAEHPDLAIEVIWTSGGLDKREIYRELGVRELWFWRQGRLTAHALRAGRYEEIDDSEVLPGIDLTTLASFLDRPSASQAIRDYRAAIKVEK